MDKASKIYTKALNEYYRGNINKAMDLCERSISVNLRNPAAINLKGLILYIKGDLVGAKSMWNLNTDINKDKVSQKYLSGISDDERKKILYNEALNHIKDIRIGEAVELLKKCEESDFNSINVANALAVCRIKQGKYDEAEAYVKRVLSLDSRNKAAHENQKILNEYGVVQVKGSSKKIGLIVSLICVITITLYAGVLGFNKLVGSGSKHQELSINKEIVIDENQDKIEAENEELKTEENKQQENTIVQQKEEAFPYENIKGAIDNKDYNTVYDIVIKWMDKNLSINDKAMFNRGVDLLQGEGVEYFYDEGRKNLEANNFQVGKNEFIKAYGFGSQSYLFPHIIYMLGYSYEKVDDIENSIKFYEIYASNYAGGDYIDTVLYRLSMVLQNIDLKKAKTYANILSTKYPKSIYNNTNISEIIKR